MSRKNDPIFKLLGILIVLPFYIIYAIIHFMTTSIQNKKMDIPAKTATHSGLKLPPWKLHTTSDFLLPRVAS
jgi:hypothetical protein